MTDLDARFHETWLGLVQPTEGLVVSIPALVDAQCGAVVEKAIVEQFLALCPARESATTGETERSISDLGAFFERVLGHARDAFEPPPEGLQLFVPEGRQTLRATLGLKRGPIPVDPLPPDASTAAQAARPYIALVWDLPEGLDLDTTETATGPWEYPPTAKFERLLREAHVAIGILTNRRAVRLIYAPAGESSGSITFRVDHMATSGGRPILDALVMLLGSHAFFTAGEKQSLPHILKDSRTRQANVTNELAEQVFDAIQILLRGFEQAYERDGSPLLDEAIREDESKVYGGLLTVLLRLVFVLYAEAWGLVPIESSIWARDYSVLALFEQLRADAGASPDSMSRRFGAWGRLLALFRAIYLGVDHESAAGTLHMPPRRGDLFNPERYPFLEGWVPVGGAPIHDPAARTAVRVPSIDDETVLGVLERLIILQGQRLSYRNLDVEQLGSVYEGLMGYHVQRLAHDAVALKVKEKPSAARAWVEVDTFLAVAPARRVGWLEDELGFDKASAKKAAEATKDAKTPEAAREALLAATKVRSPEKRAALTAKASRLVLQPGPERRRTSSHYTPRSLSAPIVRRTLEPLLAVMGDAPPSARILNLKICDPAMGSGAFLVEACRFLADAVVKAWAREGNAGTVLEARRIVAQRCLYGVDKNAYAVELAKLSLWLVTLSRDLPFTFLDHSLRHGDSLVGLDFDQIRAGHWKAGKQVELAELTLREALDEAIAIREEIVALAADPTPAAQRLKEQKLGDADDALKHARLLADLVVGAFFAHEKDKDREKERVRRVDAFVTWKKSGETEVPAQLLSWQHDLRHPPPTARDDDSARHAVPAFHWMLEFPEVFYAERPDPLDGDQVNRAAHMDAFVGNPPFMGGSKISGEIGLAYRDWLNKTHSAAEGRGDLSAHFLWRAYRLLGTHGAAGFVTTNSIAQGDTRATGLQPIVARAGRIFDATASLPWPGVANVAVSVVHFARGRAATHPDLRVMLNGSQVAGITSMLRQGSERTDPVPLQANSGCCYRGNMINGVGFVLTPDERSEFLAANAANAEVIFPYLGGEEVNSDPAQEFHRYVINFGARSVEDAARFPALLDRVHALVKPGRDAVLDDTGKGGHGKKYWWQFLDRCDPLIEALGSTTRCLVAANVTKHLVFAWQPHNRVLSNTLFVFALDRPSAFACLQSRVHEVWARLLSSTMRDDLRYAATECFATFPFPQSAPRTLIPALEDIGQRLYDARAKYMLDEQVGLTITYNRLKDPSVTEQRIVDLRRLHEEMDAAVLAAYGWSDIPVPPFCIATPDDQKALDAFETKVIDRLFALNAERAEAERLAAAATSASPKSKGRKKKGSGEGGGQGSLL
jgi:hypothetical protein